VRSVQGVSLEGGSSVVDGGSSSQAAVGRQSSLRRSMRAVGVVVVAVIAALVGVGFAPFALNEQSSSGKVADTAAVLPGQAQVATEGLRRLGFSCSDPVISPATVTRSCSRVRWLMTSRVQMDLDAETGDVQLVRITIDQDSSSATAYREILEVVGEAIGLSSDDRMKVLAAAPGPHRLTLSLGWGTAAIHPGFAPAVTLRAAGASGPALAWSTTTLHVRVDALAAAARAQGYTCTTPEVQTIRSCQRSEGGYDYDLGLEGTDTSITTLYLSVSSSYHTRTRAHWVEAMQQALGWVETEQTVALRRWLTDSAEAPGADGYVDGLRFSFLTRNDEWTKETFGGLSPDCATTVHAISDCGR